MAAGSEPDARHITALYIYQISRGCGSEGCEKAFCRRNVKRQFCGRTVAHRAILPLACHLTRLQGFNGLCEEMKRPGAEQRISSTGDIDFESPAKSPVLTGPTSSHRDVDKPRATYSLPRCLHDSQAFEIWPSYATTAVGTGVRWFQHLKMLLSKPDRDDERWFTDGVFSLVLDRESAAHFVENAPLPKFKETLEVLHDLLDSQSRYVARYVAAAFSALFEYLSTLSPTGSDSENSADSLHVSWGRHYTTSVIEESLGDHPRSRVVDLLGVACMAAGPYKQLLEVSLPNGGLDALSSSGGAVNHFPNAILRSASRYGKKTKNPLVVRSSLGEHVVVVAPSAARQNVNESFASSANSTGWIPVAKNRISVSTMADYMLDSESMSDADTVSVRSTPENISAGPHASTRYQKYRLAFVMTAAFRDLSLWPRDIAHTGAKGGLRMRDLSRTLLNNPELQPLAIPGGPCSLQRYFRRYPNLPGGSAYLAAFPWLLRQNSVALFKYGCLRQMASSLRRVENITAAMYHLRALLRQDDGVMIRPITYVVLDVDRTDFIQSAVKSLSRALLIENAVRRPLRVRFDGEEAVDEGGLQVEFFQAFGYLLSHSNHGFFRVDEESHMAYLNPGYTGSYGAYEYLGMLFALGVYNGCIVDVSLPIVFYDILRALVCGADPDAFLTHEWDEEDIAELHPTVARSLARLRELSESELQVLELTFDWTLELDTGEIRTEPLLSVLQGTEVTAENLDMYIRLYVAKTLYLSVAKCFGPFAMGFRYIISDHLLAFLSSEQLRKVVEGTTYIDLAKLRAVTQYDGFRPDSPTVRFFWDIVFGFDEEHKGMLLEFVTGSRRVPVGGMDQFSFVLQRNGTDTSRLPSASVCFSRLLLPEYKSRDELKKMLLLALDHSKGFGLM